MKGLLCLLILSAPLIANDLEQWVESVSKRVSSEAVLLAKELSSEKKQFIQEKPMGQLQHKQSYQTLMSKETLFICVSFSLPDACWVSLSKELRSTGGRFVIRGLPDDSFGELIKKVAHLKKIGVQASIDINPLLFQEAEVEAVPTFVLKREGRLDKVAGNTTLSHAMAVLNG